MDEEMKKLVDDVTRRLQEGEPEDQIAQSLSQQLQIPLDQAKQFVEQVKT